MDLHPIRALIHLGQTLIERQHAGLSIAATQWSTLYQRIHEAEATFRALEARLDWQPIETAPKDREILLAREGDFFHEGYVARGWWMSHPLLPDDGEWAIVGGKWTPTHWRELPKAPRRMEAA